MAPEYTREVLRIADAYITPSTVAVNATIKIAVTIQIVTETVEPIYPFSGVPFYSGENMYSGG